MSHANRYRVLLFACLLLLSSPSRILADTIAVLDQSIRPVSAVSGGRFFKIAWEVQLRNDAPRPQTCLITVSFLNGDDKVIGKTTKKQPLKALEVKTASGTVQLRAALARQIVSSDVSVKVELNSERTPRSSAAGSLQ